MAARAMVRRLLIGVPLALENGVLIEPMGRSTISVAFFFVRSTLGALGVLHSQRRLNCRVCATDHTAMQSGPALVVRAAPLWRSEQWKRKYKITCRS